MSGHKPFRNLLEKMPKERRAGIKAETATMLAEMPLNELRQALELSQKHLAEILHVDQPAISRLERRTDMMISTLSRFIEAMGGHLVMRAVFPTGTVAISGLRDIKRPGENKSKQLRQNEERMPAQ